MVHGSADAPRSTFAAYKLRVPPQELRSAHSAFAFQLNFVKAKGALTGCDDQLLIASQDFTRRSTEIHN